ncbi:MAG: hypothetical protein JW952_06830 [Candidatus Eisenbacteria bacterium]|nr:hypothetical protein [Candidatus Eisenbacteria bacterium]
MARGALSEQHYQNYLKLKKETSHYETSYADRRRKDRAFGRFLKSAKKQMEGRKPKG